MIIPQLERLLQEQNWGKLDFTIKPATFPPLIAAGTDDQGQWHIHLQVDERLQGLDKILARYQNDGLGQLFRKKDNYFTGRNNLDNILYFVVGHEVGHWKYCPGNIDEREEIISGIAQGLAESCFTKEQIEQYSQQLYNLFADILDNVMSMYRDKKAQQFIDGFLAFYAKEGLRKDYSDDFFIFVDTIVKLGVSGTELKDFAAAFHQEPEKLAPTTLKVLELLVEDRQLAGKAFAEEITLDEKIKVYQALDDRDKWHDKAREFAKLLAPYLKQQKPGKHRNSHPHPGEGNGAGNNSTGNDGNTGNDSADGHDVEGQDKRLLRELVKKSLGKERVPLYAPKPVALDEIYRQRAERIVIALKTKEGEALKLPVSYLARREIDERYFDFNQVDWQNPEFGVDEQGRDEIKFFQKQVPHFLERKGYEKGGQLPDILWVIDVSRSIICGYDPVAGVGPYDMLLRSVYSTFQQLEESDQIQHMKCGLVLFEEIPNYFSGWHTFYNLQSIKEALLDPGKYHPEQRPKKRRRAEYANRICGGTDLDEKIVKEAADANSNRFWTILVSDGALTNPQEACSALSYLAAKGPLSFMRIGTSPQLVVESHILQVGGMVHPALNVADLPRIILGKQEEIYGE